jgi:hypothetical protein
VTEQIGVVLLAAVCGLVVGVVVVARRRSVEDDRTLPDTAERLEAGL